MAGHDYRRFIRASLDHFVASMDRPYGEVTRDWQENLEREKGAVRVERLRAMKREAHAAAPAVTSNVLTCPDCGRPFPPHEGLEPEVQGCGRLAVPVPHVGLCIPTDDKGGFAVRWSSRPVQKSLSKDGSLPAVGSFYG